MELSSQARDKYLFLAGGVALGGLITYFLTRKSLKPNQDSRAAELSNPASTKHANPKLLEDLMKEQLVRNYQYFGEEGQNKVRKSFVVVIGVGGVGSHVVSALGRSGVGKLRVIDFDQVSLSSLNRHAFALRKDVGKNKVDVLKDYIQQINPHIEVDCRGIPFNAKSKDELLSGNPDMVIDCIDDIQTKVELIKTCYERKIPILSSGGAGMKADFTRIQLRDISETNCKVEF